MSTVQKNELESIQKEIDKKITYLYSKNCVYDGIINIEKFFSSKIKIMWILKEINDISGYNQREVFNKTFEEIIKNNSLHNSNRKYWWRTLDPVIYISYMILNNINNCSNLNLKTDLSILNAFLSIAYINIKKTPGASQSNDNILEKSYNESKYIINDQIDFIKPDIIIGGNTIKYMKTELGIDNTNPEISENVIKYYESKNILIIDSCHPNYISRLGKIRGNVYINKLVSLVNSKIKT